MTQKKSNQKGFTLVEVLLTLLIIGIISVIVTQLLVFNVSSTRAFSMYNNQQYTVQDAFVRLSKDIEAASDITFDSTDWITGDQYKSFTVTIEGTDRKWTIENGTLFLSTAALGTKEIITGFTDDSIFIWNNDCLTVKLKPKSTNTGKNPVNVPNPIVYQYSLKYK